MSENLDLVRSIYADWERGDFSSAAWADPEIEFRTVGGPDAVSATGLEGMMSAWRTFLGSWEGHHTEPANYREVGDGRVLVCGPVSTRGRGSGLDLRSSVATLFEVRDAKVVRLVLYWDAERALADLGTDPDEARAAAPTAHQGAEADVSEPGVEVVRRYFEAASHGDFASAMAEYSPDVVLVVPDGVLPTEAGTVTGREAVGEWFADWFRSFARGYRFDLEETRLVGNRVVVVARHSGVGRSSGAPIDWSIGYVFTIGAGKIARLELHRGLEDALTAAGDG
jgi:ketosteroid isomerase-like protein